MRVAAAVFIAAHGLGHIIWVMVTWAQWALGSSGRADLAKHKDRFLVEAMSPMGKVIGMLALLALIGFVAAGIGIWTQTSWWPFMLIGSVAISTIVLVVMWNPVMTVSARALIANVGLTAAMFMPWGERILGAQ